MRSAIFSHTRKTKFGSAVTCRNWTHKSVAMTSSTGSPPSATTTPDASRERRQAWTSGAADRRPGTGGCDLAAIQEPAMASERQETAPGQAPPRTVRSGPALPGGQWPGLSRPPAACLCLSAANAILTCGAERDWVCPKSTACLPAGDFPDPLRGRWADIYGRGKPILSRDSVAPIP